MPSSTRPRSNVSGPRRADPGRIPRDYRSSWDRSASDRADPTDPSAQSAPRLVERLEGQVELSASSQLDTASGDLKEPTSRLATVSSSVRASGWAWIHWASAEAACAASEAALSRSGRGLTISARSWQVPLQGVGGRGEGVGHGECQARSTTNPRGAAGRDGRVAAVVAPGLVGQVVVTGEAIVFGELGPGVLIRVGLGQPGPRLEQVERRLGRDDLADRPGATAKEPVVSSAQCGGSLARKAANSKFRRGWPAAIRSWLTSRLGSPSLAGAPTWQPTQTAARRSRSLRTVMPYSLEVRARVPPAGLRVRGEPEVGRAVARLAAHPVAPKRHGPIVLGERVEAGGRVTGQAPRVLVRGALPPVSFWAISRDRFESRT